MTIKEFIESAIDGGWEGKVDLNEWGGEIMSDTLNRVVLDPKAWQAVGKVEGWGHMEVGEIGNYVDEALVHMHQMIDALAEGISIEGFIKTL